MPGGARGRRRVPGPGSRQAPNPPEGSSKSQACSQHPTHPPNPIGRSPLLLPSSHLKAEPDHRTPGTQGWQPAAARRPGHIRCLPRRPRLTWRATNTALQALRAACARPSSGQPPSHATLTGSVLAPRTPPAASAERPAPPQLRAPRRTGPWASSLQAAHFLAQRKDHASRLRGTGPPPLPPPGNGEQ